MKGGKLTLHPLMSTAISAAARTTYGLPVGRIIDSLMRHAVADPNFKLSTAGRRKQLIRPDRIKEVLSSGYLAPEAKSS